MIIKKPVLATLLATGLFTSPVVAEVCDYRPSELIGEAGTTAVAAGTGVTAGLGASAKAAGLYTLTHATTGVPMLGSTAGGASVAGTVGIMGGTAGVGAAVIGIAANPLVWIPAAAAAIGVVGFEGGCALFANEDGD